MKKYGAQASLHSLKCPVGQLSGSLSIRELPALFRKQYAGDRGYDEVRHCIKLNDCLCDYTFSLALRSCCTDHVFDQDDDSVAGYTAAVDGDV